MTDIPVASRTRADIDDVNVTSVSPKDDSRTVMLNKVAWGAVFAGVALALVTQLFLNLLGVGIGAATLDVAGGSSPTASSFSIGAGIWFTLSTILAALVGGYTAGRLSGKPKTSTAGWHGLTTWALTTLVVVYMLTSAAGGILGGAYSGLTGAMGGIANTAGSTVQTAVQAAAPNMQGMDPMASIRQSMQGAGPGNDPAAMKDKAFTAVQGVLTGDPAKAAESRENAAQSIASAQGVPIEQARTQVQEYEQQYRDTMAKAKEQATKAADLAAKGTSTAALLAALGLLLGAIAGWFGGRMGTVDPTVQAKRLGNRPVRQR